ncbi:unnamed protein product [Allacma fusca]|uniref:Uncharacterized protein n=1 Tax=Allacma fusca TaxID=39272 RepID=A0A8J2KMD4_9HEXA|nr:unnamed protein product [Allacma fusca]
MELEASNLICTASSVPRAVPFSTVMIISYNDGTHLSPFPNAMVNRSLLGVAQIHSEPSWNRMIIYILEGVKTWKRHAWELIASSEQKHRVTLRRLLLLLPRLAQIVN